MAIDLKLIFAENARKHFWVCFLSVFCLQIEGAGEVERKWKAQRPSQLDLSGVSYNPKPLNLDQFRRFVDFPNAPGVYDIRPVEPVIKKKEAVVCRPAIIRQSEMPNIQIVSPSPVWQPASPVRHSANVPLSGQVPAVVVKEVPVCLWTEDKSPMDLAPTFFTGECLDSLNNILPSGSKPSGLGAALVARMVVEMNHEQR